MKGLRKIIYPFAPDQSGAVSVLYDLGGMIVVCDAGGCTGNICGFDEPRWVTEKSAVFSAGLRDMDAILGRDDVLVQKMADTAKKLGSPFAAVIGTPVPATIATDFAAVRRLAERKLGIPVLTVASNGIRWYDEGISAAYRELFGLSDRTDSGAGIRSGRVGVLGALPLDLGGPHEAEMIAEELRARGAREVIGYGAGASLDDVRRARETERNVVIAPSGLAAARWLQEQFGTPYTCEYPRETAYWDELCGRILGGEPGRRILIVHQQVYAGELRRQLFQRGAGAEVTAATWFLQDEALRQPQDFRIREEDEFLSLADAGYNVICGDPVFRRALAGFSGRFVPLPHYAVSGRWDT